MNKPNSTLSGSSQRTRCAESFVRTRVAPKLALALLGGLAFIACVLLAMPAQAQYIRFRAGQVRVTVPLLSSSSIVITNLVQIGGGMSNTPVVALDLGTNGLPLRALASLDNYTAPSNGAMTSLTLATTNVPGGVYTFSINATGVDLTNALTVSNKIFFTLQVGAVWNGPTNALAEGTRSWTDTTMTNWQGGDGTTLPGTSDDVIFTSGGAQTNQLYLATGLYLTNVIISDDVTIGSLRFSMSNAAYKAHTFYIAPDKTLRITGTNGFSFLRDYVSALVGFGNADVMNVTFLGTSGTLVVSNKDANFALLSDNSGPSSSTFSSLNGVELTQLGNFYADVNRMALGDYQLYPFYNNYAYSNNYGGATIRNWAARLDLARTNVIRATYVDPWNFNDTARRDYSLTLGNNEGGGTSSNPSYTLLFGVSNIFLVDSICFGHASMSSVAQFNPSDLVFTNFPSPGVTNYVTNVCRAYFRNTNGVDRVSMWAQSDDAQGTNLLSTSNCKGTVSFLAGVVDAKVDRLAICRDRGLNTDGVNAQSVLMVGAGVFDVNNAWVGYQNAYNEHTNRMYCAGSLIVSNSWLGAAVFKVNNELSLGYTTEDPANPNNGTGDNQVNEQNGYGQVTLLNGATLMASNITVGGLTKLSGGHGSENYIRVGDNCNLIVSNAVAASDKMLGTFAFTGTNATVELFINGNRSTPYIYATNFTTASAVNYVQIGSVTNVTYTAGVATIPLVAFGAGQSPAILGVFMPPGFVGSGQILTNGGTGWNLTICTNPPNTNLLWRPIPGIPTTNWDTTSYVWSNLDTGTMTNFHTGDWVTFDDTPNLASNINQTVSVLLPGKITMTNRFVKYTIMGSGLQGGGILTKTGTNMLVVEGKAAVAIALAQGILTNGTTGVVGGVAVTAGATLINNGQINGGIDCAGTAISAGTINGTVGIRSDGVVTNLSGGNINGLPTFQERALLHNAGTITYLLGFTCTVASNATFINDYNINGDNLTVNGTLKDTGNGKITLYNTLTINGTPTTSPGTNPVGALFIPGGDGAGFTKVVPDARSSATYPGRVSLKLGSRTILKVTNNMNTVVYSGYQDFGDSVNHSVYNGCTLVITNIGTTPFSEGRVFTMFQAVDSDGYPQPEGRYYYDGSSTNNYPLIDPPGPPVAGLAWDLKYLIVWDGSGHNGKIGIIGTAVNPPAITNLFIQTNGVITETYVTNDQTHVVTTNFATNNLMHVYLNWPPTNTGWRLQSQQNTLDVGLYTNWVTVFQTPWTNQLHLTNSFITNNVWFYRMVYP